MIYSDSNYSPASGEYLLEMKDFCFSYPDQTANALDQICLSLLPGSFNVLFGLSGCGKSTLLRQFKPVLQPHGRRRGSLQFCGKDLNSWDSYTLSSAIGFVMQDPDAQIVTDKVWHELAFGLESLGYDSDTIRLRVAEMASYFGIQQWFHRDVEELSGGQKQLLNLASIMAMHPSLLILDEPTSQLDPIAASDFLETIRKINRDLGITILMTEHRLEDLLPAADTAILMDQGKILFTGPPRDAGLWLYKNQHPMFQSMPAPLQIFAEAEISRSDLREAPLTVREGRNWLNQVTSWHWTGIGSKGSATSESSSQSSFDKDQRESASPSPSAPILEMKDIWFRFEKESPDILRGFSLKLYPGQIYCLLGGNGAGKSTALSLMTRVRKPYRGRILLQGKDIRHYSDYELYREFLGVIPQNPQSLFVKKTVELELYEMIGGSRQKISEEFPVDMNKSEVIHNIAQLTHLEHLLDHHPYDLSGGEQQRLALAKILLLRPRLLLMDEPTKGMDASFKEEFAEILGTLTQHGLTVFMISHDIEFCARYADRCGMLFDGGLVTENKSQRFFAGNNFYTTSTNRMVRHLWPDAIVPAQVLDHLRNHKEEMP